MASDYFIFDDFLNAAEVRGANLEIDDLLAQEAFRPARVGSGAGVQVQEDVRRDQIYWVDESSASSTQKMILSRLNVLKEKFNREYFSGLWNFEGHYAVYPPGAFYRKHVDQFQNSDLRTLSVILYLNSAWRQGDGGELVLHLRNDTAPIKIQPVGGRLVCFFSRDLPHEVLPCHRVRRSFTGWFKKRE